MSADQGEDAERFATAVERGRSPDAAGDAALARDLEIVAMLRSRRAEFDPHPDARARARARLMAALAEEPPLSASAVPAPPAPEHTAPLDVVAAVPVDDATPTEQMPRVEREAGAAPVPASARPGRASRRRAPGRAAGRTDAPTGPGRGLRRRGVLIGAAALVVLLAVAGGGVLASRDALPGDALYGVKRAAESAGLALTFDDAAQARRQLELATTRLDEVEQLSRTGGADPQLLRSTIQDFDAATGEGSRGLLAGEDAGGAAALADLRVWAADQAARLSRVREVLPTPAASEAEVSLKMLDRLVGRAEALEGRASCDDVTSGTVDDLGPLPAQGACVPRAGAPGGGGVGAPGRAPTGGPGVPGAPGVPVVPGPPGPAVGEQAQPGRAPGTGGGTGPGAGSPAPATSTPPTTAPAPRDEDSDGGLLPDVSVPPLLPGLPGLDVG